MEKQRSSRHQELINRDWTFMYGNVEEGRKEVFDDSAWYTIGLPHSFGIPYFMEGDFYVGYGSYRKWVSIDEAWLGKKISLEFQGAFQDANVYLNGQFVGNHKGGYTAFQMDISSLVRSGENLLFVELNNLWNSSLAPRAGEHVFNGGIYRDVSLIVTEPLHVAWYGTFVTTPEVSEEQATINIQTEVINEHAEPVSCTLVSKVQFEGEQVFELSDTQMIGAGEEIYFSGKQSIEVPKLWHPDTPQMYELISEVYLADKLVDTYKTSFGIRWFRFDAQEGFFLNGKSYDIHGANVHQDHAGWSDAVTHAGIVRDISLMKEAGFNFIRGSHYPHHTYFSAECDRQGLLFWSELCYWGTGGPKMEGYWTSSGYPIHEDDKEAFEESCITALQEMIRTNRNHPSIIVWSMSNEPFFSDEEVMEEARALVVRLVEESHRLDASRPAAVGGAQRKGFDVLGDLAGYNGDGAALFENPGFPNFVSEYGCVIADRPGEYAPYYGYGVEQNPKWRSGKALWCGFHHGSILFDMGHMGIVDYYRLPLNAWYWYRENLQGIAPPAPSREGEGYKLQLTVDKSIIQTDGTDDTHIIVQILDREGHRINNPATVTLEVISGGGIFPTGRRIDFSTAAGSFLDGMGAIEMRSYYAGPIVVKATGEGLISTEITITATGEVEWSNQRIHWQEGPPSRMKAPTVKESHNIAISRPVFCSSYAPECSSMNVTDGRKETWWQAAEHRAGEWLMVDLEGNKSANRAMIQWTEPIKPSTDLEIAYSFDGNEFIVIDGIEKIGEAVVFALPARTLRYLKVSFPSEPVGIRDVSIFYEE